MYVNEHEWLSNISHTHKLKQGNTHSLTHSCFIAVLHYTCNYNVHTINFTEDNNWFLFGTVYTVDSIALYFGKAYYFAVLLKL